MEQNEMPFDYGEAIINWEVPEYEKRDRGKEWYYIAIIVIVLLMISAVYTRNLLFALIIITGSLAFYINDRRNPELVKVTITTEGVVVGKKFYDYDDFKDFSVVYKPNYGIENLYFEFNNPIRQRLSIPLNGINPLPIRENLLQYLPEDLERTDEPTSEGVAKILKL